MRGDVPLPTRDMPGPRLSLHGKLLVIDRRYSVVTSHNLDPRSENWNTENGLVVDDPEFAMALLRYVDRVTSPGNSWVSALQPTSGGIFSSINRAGTRVSRALPVLDLWPDYRFEQYDRAGDQEVPVGLSPEVAAWQRRWITSMVSRMMGFLRPIL
jgi:phosphatidylserine/phosphatidylglycerophosphate/cardiolipin synthase-like enzyme